MDRQRNDATATAQGMVFQFFAALDACFNMSEGEQVYVERYGDVTLLSPNDSNQIEAKKRKNKLTNHCDEIWNTIYNWLNSDVPWQNFSNLIYLTTQVLDPSTVWAKWNEMNPYDRYNEFKNLLKGTKRLKSNSKNRLTKIDAILNEDEKREFVKRIVISTATETLGYWQSKLKKYIHGVPQLRIDDCINSLLGFITKKGLHSTGWIISYDEFNDYMENLSLSLISTTTSFPVLHKADPNVADYQEKMFVRKLREISFEDEEVIADAVIEYATAMS